MLTAADTGDPSHHVHRHTPGSARAALSYPRFRRLWAASFSSNVGTWMQNVVLPLYVLDRTGKASVVALMVVAQLGPLLVLSIPAGVIADRFDRRRWLISMQMVQLGFSALLAPLAAGDASIALIFLVSLGVGVGNALNAPAWSAMLPGLVRKEDIAGSVALNSAMINGSRVLGPVFVAVLREFGVTTPQMFLVNAATYLFVIVALWRTPVSTPPRRPSTRPVEELMTGLRIARSRPVIGRLLVSLFTFSLLSLPYVGLFPAVARLNFGIAKGSTAYEWLYAVWGLGAAAGGLAVGTVFVRVDKRRLIRLGFAAFAVFMAAFAVSRSPLGAFLAAPFLGAAYFGTTTAMNTVLQMNLADHERGRVMSLWFMSFGGTVPIGNIVFGPVIDAVGSRWVLLLGAAWAVVLAWWCDIARIEHAASAAEHSRNTVESRHAAPLDEHGISGGE